MLRQLLHGAPLRVPVYARPLLLLFAWVPAFAGQRLLEGPSDSGWVGYLLGFAMVFVAAFGQTDPHSTFAYPPPDPRLRRRLWLLPALGLSAVAFYGEWSGRIPARAMAGLWCLSLAAMLLPFVLPFPASRLPARSSLTLIRRLATLAREQPRARWAEALSCALLMAAAWAFRWPYLERFPLLIHNDEANCALMARKLVAGWHSGEAILFKTCGAQFYDFANLGFVPSALAQALLTPNLFAHRLANVVLGLVALACLYLLVRSVWGPAAALLSLALGATAHTAVHWSRSGISSGHATWLMVICGFLVWKAVSTGRTYWFVLTGFGLGACFVTYGAALFAPLWLGLVLAGYSLGSPHFRRRYAASLAVALLATAAFLAPVLANRARARSISIPRQSSLIFTSDPDSIKHMKESAGDHYLVGTLQRNLHLAVRLLPSTHDSNRQYGYTGGGMVDPLTAIACVLGTAVAAARVLTPPYAALLLGLFVNWLVGAVLTMDAVQYSRVAGIALLVLILPALWGRELLASARSAAGWWGTIAVTVVLAAGLILIGSSNFRLYFRDHDRRSWNHRADVLLSFIAREARDGGRDNATLVFAPQMPVDFRHRSYQFVAADRHLAAFDDPGAVGPPEGKVFAEATFLASPENGRVLDQIEQRFPGGRREPQYMPFGPPPPLYIRYVARLSGIEP